MSHFIHFRFKFTAFQTFRSFHGNLSRKNSHINHTAHSDWRPLFLADNFAPTPSTPWSSKHLSLHTRCLSCIRNPHSSVHSQNSFGLCRYCSRSKTPLTQRNLSILRISVHLHCTSHHITNSFQWNHILKHNWYSQWRNLESPVLRHCRLESNNQ